MAKRSKAREVALQVLYEDDLNPGGEPVDRTEFLRTRLQDDADLIGFAESLIAGVRRNRPELDALLVKTAENWSLERMATTDRNVLRLGAFEILFTQTPAAVAINEAVELAKRFGAAQSAPFVNGILDKFIEGHGKAKDE
jgi:N utilization substance protein B